jgi:hypothetical protein
VISLRLDADPSVLLVSNAAPNSYFYEHSKTFYTSQHIIAHDAAREPAVNKPAKLVFVIFKHPKAHKMTEILHPFI